MGAILMNAGIQPIKAVYIYVVEECHVDKQSCAPYGFLVTFGVCGEMYILRFVGNVMQFVANGM